MKILNIDKKKCNTLCIDIMKTEGNMINCKSYDSYKYTKKI